MKPAPFAYAKARSVEHAIELLGEHGDGAQLLAGGQSLIATLNMRLSQPALLVDINGIAGLDGIALQGRPCRDRRAGAPRASRALGRHRQPRAADRPGDAAYRPSGDPQPRHHRRLDRLCRSGRRTAGLLAGARRRSRDRRARQAARTVKADDFFKALFETALAPQRRADRDPRSRRRRADTRVGFAELRAGTATTPWRACRLRARRRQSARRTCGSPISASDSTPVRAQSAEAALAAGDIDAAVQALAHRSRSARRRAGDRRGEDASRRRAAAARRARS